jgi:hypothetical protein
VSDLYVVQPFVRRGEELRAEDPVSCGTEDEAFRKGLAMRSRMAGLAFFRIDTSASGDQWTEIELLCSDGEVPPEVLAA